jgi:hypothetical protein
MDKILKYASYALVGISSLIALLFFFTDAVGENFYIIWTYILTGLATGITVVFSIFYYISHPNDAKGALVGIGAMAVVVLLAWLFASDDIPQFLGADKFEITSTMSRTVGAILWGVYILLTAAIVAIFYSEATKSLKK